MNPTRLRVLVVEDDPEMRELYRRFFGARSAEGFDAAIVKDGESALSVLRDSPIDLVVLDWGLPGMSGTSLARALRSHARTRSLGILMVTARGSVAETVTALDAGADDHMVKPFDDKVLLARLRSLARRRDLALEGGMAERFPGLDLDVERGTLRVGGRESPLRLKELELLKIFLRRPGVIHSRQFLWETAWGHESDGWEHVLEATLSSLRRKLGPRWGVHLRVKRGLGYAFDPDSV